MTALVVLTAGGQTYALPVEQTGGVLEHAGVEPLPDPLPGVRGLIRTERGATLTVLAPFTDDGEHVLVVTGGPDGPFGLLAGQVTGIVKVDPQAIGPAPAGQQTAVVAGVVRTRTLDALLLDPAALGARLRSVPT